MPSLLLVLFTLFIFLVFISFLFLLNNYKKPYSLPTKTSSFSKLLPTAIEQEYNPDINTKNWDLHKIRLNKFRRSQYKGLSFF